MADGRWTGSGREDARRYAATPDRPQQRSRALVLLLALLTASAGLLVAGAPPRAAAQNDTEVQIRLDQLSPSVAHADSTIVFEGTVTNTSDRPLNRLQAMIWRNLTPYTTATDLDYVNRSAPTDPVGERMYSGNTPDAYQDLYTDAQPDLAPGASKTFRLTAKASDFFGTSTPRTGVYLAGVQVRENGVTTVGRTRTYLPFTASDALADGQTPVGTSTVVELAAAPSMTRSGVFSNDDLADEISPGGRLDTLLRAAEQAGASYAVDPNLISELQSMKAGYKVLGSDGKQTAGSGSDEAAAWLARFTAMQSGHDGYRLLYGQPDLVSLVHAGRLDIVRRAEKAAAGVSQVKDLPLLVAPADGAADRPTLQAAKDLGARAVLLADSTVNGLGPVIKAANSPTILSYTTSAEAGPGPDPRDTEVQLRQSTLASSYVDSISGQAGSVGRLRVVADADQAESAAAALQAPWLQPRTVGQLLTDQPETLGTGLTYPESARKAEIRPRQLRRLDNLEQGLTAYQHLLSSPGSIGTLIDQALPRVASQSWRGHRLDFTHYVKALELLLTDADGAPLSLDDLTDGDAVQLESNAQVTLTGSSATIPVTVVNNLGSTVSVEVLAESANQSRLRLDDVQALTIAPGARVPVQIPAHADANGSIEVTLRLATQDGDEIGRPVKVQVNATRAGLVGWVIAIAAGIVLLLTVVLRIRQVARERGDGEEAATDEEAQADDKAQADEENEDTVIRPRITPDDTAGGPGSELSRNGIPRG